MTISRRKFIELSLLSTTSLLLNQGCSSKSSNLGIILGGGQYIDFDHGGTVENLLVAYDLDRSQSKHIVTHFLPHGIAIDPLNANRVISFEKKGRGACEINLKKGAVTKNIPTLQSRHFYGHGIFSPDGQKLFSTETYLRNEKGAIIIRNGTSLEVIGEFPSYGENPHDCKLHDNGQVLAVTNAGTKRPKNSGASVCYIDLNSQELIERVNIPAQHLNAGHLAHDHSNNLVVSSAPRDGLPHRSIGGVTIRKSGSQPSYMDTPQSVSSQLTGEALSIAIHTDLGIAAITHPDANTITLWSLKAQKLIKAIKLSKVRGATTSKDGKYFIFSYGANTELAFLNAKTLAFSHQQRISQSYIGGSHLYNWGSLSS